MAHLDGEDPRAAALAAERADRDARAAAAGRDPDLVWHYTDGPGLISILTHDVLWATASGFLNDQTEVALGLRLVADRVRQLADAAGDETFAVFADRLDDTPADAVADLSPARFFILSASQTWDSLAMWRNYGGVRESYAIGLDRRSPLAVLAEGYDGVGGSSLGPSALVKRQPWRPVAYTPDAQRALVDAVFDEMPEQIAAARTSLTRADRDPEVTSPHELPEAAQDLMDELEQALLLVKHEGFVDERETRYSVVIWEGGAPTDHRLPAGAISYRSTAYGVAPYLRLTGADHTAAVLTAAPARLPIRAVAISPSPNGVAATDSLTRLLADRGYPDVPVLRSRIPFRAG